MTKSKEFIESDDDLSGDEVKKKPVAKKRKNDDSDEESDNGKASNVKEVLKHNRLVRLMFIFILNYSFVSNFEEETSRQANE
jgi:hypothetical protein